VRTETKALIALCLFGTCIAIVGAVLRSSNDDWLEKVGMITHEIGMGVMLLGFGGMFLLSQFSIGRKKGGAFSWSDVDGVFIVRPIVRREILNISEGSEGAKSIAKIVPHELVGVRCLIARNRTIEKETISQMAKTRQLQVLDLQNAFLEEGALLELELLEGLEVLLVAGCLQPSQAKELRIAMPETKMIFDPR